MKRLLSATAVTVTAIVLLGLAIDAHSRVPVDRPQSPSKASLLVASGRVEGVTSEVALRPQGVGRIVRIFVQEGQYVKEGTVLLQLDGEQAAREAPWRPPRSRWPRLGWHAC